MSRSHYFEQCRAIYQTAREEGSPAVHITNLGCGSFCGETADGEILVEEIKGCCKWAMKYEIARTWLDKSQ